MGIIAPSRHLCPPDTWHLRASSIARRGRQESVRASLCKDNIPIGQDLAHRPHGRGRNGEPTAQARYRQTHVPGDHRRRVADRVYDLRATPATPFPAPCTSTLAAGTGPPDQLPALQESVLGSWPSFMPVAADNRYGCTRGCCRVPSAWLHSPSACSRTSALLSQPAGGAFEPNGTTLVDQRHSFGLLRHATPQHAQAVSASAPRRDR